MDYDALLKAIADATSLRQLIDAKMSEKNKAEAQIAANEKEMARLEGLAKSTENLKSIRGGLLKSIAELNAELNKRMRKLNEEGVELPLQVGGPKATVSL